MKLFLRVLPAVLLGVALLVTLQAQDKKPKTWEEMKAAKLKPVSDDLQGKIAEALPTAASAVPKKTRNLLVFWRCGGFVHGSISHGNHALEQMAKKTKAFSVTLADDYSVFTKENLANYDAVIFNNTTRLELPEESMRQALIEFLAEGKGVVGIHGASDNFYKWEAGAQMIGGQFNGHPWGGGGDKWAFQLDDADHPINKAFDGKGFWHSDEIYQYKPETFVGAKKMRILVSLDMSKEANTKVLETAKNKKYAEQYGPGPRQVPVSWIREYGGGRVFYTNLGHREDTFANPHVLRHMLDGIQFALGDLEADTTPTGDSPEAPVPAPDA